MNNILNQIISQNMTVGWTTVFLAFCAGFITSLSPCCLSTVSMLVALVNGNENPTSFKSFKISLVFAFGATITFTCLGIVGSILGKLFFISDGVVYLILGSIMVLMSLQLMELYTFVPSSTVFERHFYCGYAGAFTGGLFSGFFSAPCCTPVLIAIISMIATSNNLFFGIITMLSYAIAHNLISIAAGTSFGFAQSLIHGNTFKHISNILKYILGAAILLIGLSLIYKGL